MSGLRRRQFIWRGLAALAAAGAGLAGYAYAIETRRVQFEQRSIPIPDLPAHLDGFTIGLLADLHVGPTTPASFVREVAAQLAARKPDLVVVAGDFIGSHSDGPAANWALEPVKGCLGVVGNWDYYDRFIYRFMTNVRLLVNEGVQVADGLWVGGVDEPRLGEPDLARAMAGAPEGAVRILLCHEPDYADSLVRPEHRVALQLSGHSHAGQIRLPGLGPLLLPPGGRKYHTGLYQAAHCQVYTTRGVGTAHLPFRLFCPPEVSLLQLTRA
ncbi:MAG: metallophosphoesterase [Bacillota bacterium]